MSEVPARRFYRLMVRWRQAGAWDRLVDTLAASQHAVDQVIDTSVVRVPQYGAYIADNNHQDIGGRSQGP
jgi:hypothetical protein